MIGAPVLRASFLILGLVVPSTIAVPGARKVMTPHGERSIANVHIVPADGEVRHVGSAIHLVDGAGRVLHVAQNDGTPVREPAPTRTSNTSIAAFQTGWVAYAGWRNDGASPISSFDTTWTVPPTPESDNSQTVFLFSSIEPTDGKAIIQPVLQYGYSAAGGGPYWAVASWYIVGSETYYTSPITVSAGQTLQGLITLTGYSDNSYDYTSTFTNVAMTSLNAKNSTELVWATETLESYRVVTINDYPSGTTVFSNINIKTQAGIPSVQWDAVSDDIDGLITTINKQGAIGAEITIAY